MDTSLNAENEQTARLSCRVNPRIKQRAEAAAALLGQSMTDFTEAALKEKAEAVLEQVHKIQLSERASSAFSRPSMPVFPLHRSWLSPCRSTNGNAPWNRRETGRSC